jgi:hypothetical protein
MSKHVKTRNGSQCRSHHQKMLKSHGNLFAIIAYIEGLQKSDLLKLENEIEVEKSDMTICSTPNVELREIAENWENSPSLWETLVQSETRFI